MEGTRSCAVKIDKTSPSVTINVPLGEYFVGQEVFANWLANDTVSGIATVTATTPNETAIDTSTIGLNNFNVNASDNAGNQENKTVTFSVVEYYNGEPHFINGTVIDSERETHQRRVYGPAGFTAAEVSVADASGQALLYLRRAAGK